MMSEPGSPSAIGVWSQGTGKTELMHSEKFPTLQGCWETEVIPLKEFLQKILKEIYKTETMTKQTMPIYKLSEIEKQREFAKDTALGPECPPKFWRYNFVKGTGKWICCGMN